MPCYQSTNLPSGITTSGRTAYQTEADCNQACKEGACCDGTTCTVKPQCQCQGTGKTFKGVGTTCATGACCTPFTNGCSPPFVGNGALAFPQTITASVSVDAGATWPFGPQSLSGAYIMDFAAPQASNQCAQYYRLSTVQGKFVDVRSSWFFTSVNGVATPAMSFTMWDFALSYWGFFAFPATGPCIVNSYIPATACFSASANLYQRVYEQSSQRPCSELWKQVGTVQVSG